MLMNQSLDNGSVASSIANNNNNNNTSTLSLATHDFDHAVQCIHTLEEENSQLRNDLQVLLQRLQQEHESGEAMQRQHRELSTQVQKLQTKHDNQKVIFDTALEIKQVEVKIAHKERDILSTRVKELMQELRAQAHQQQQQEAAVAAQQQPGQVDYVQLSRQLQADLNAQRLQAEAQLHEAQWQYQQDLLMAQEDAQTAQQDALAKLAAGYEEQLLQLQNQQHDALEQARQVARQEAELQFRQQQQQREREREEAAAAAAKTKKKRDAAAKKKELSSKNKETDNSKKKKKKTEADGSSNSKIQTPSSSRLSELRAKRDSLRNKYESVRSNLSVASTKKPSVVAAEDATASTAATSTRSHSPMEVAKDDDKKKSSSSSNSKSSSRKSKIVAPSSKKSAGTKKDTAPSVPEEGIPTTIERPMLEI